MKRWLRLLTCLILLTGWNALKAQYYSYLPTGVETDGKMLIMAGGNLSSIMGQDLQISFEVAQGIPEMEIGVFDGDSRGYYGGGHWDADYPGYGVYSITFRVYADPSGNGTGMTFLGEWQGNSMVDNGWYDIRISQPAAARILTGNYRYRVIIKTLSPNNPGNYNNFKIRINGSLRLVDSILGFNAMLGSPERFIIYPNYPNTVPTSYDGEWKIYFYLPKPVQYLEIWDGDFDFGNANGTIKDTDDPDTPNNAYPSWSPATGMRNEGIAIGTGASSGSPTDDNNSILYRRSPAIYYEVIDPLGIHYVNANPSGNQEWERFRIDTAPFDRNLMDYHADALPAGVYTILLHGVDMHNFNFWKFFNEVIGQDLQGNPIKGVIYPPEILASVGDYLWHDIDKDGEQDPDEPPLPNVILRLYNDLGYPVSKVRTDANGKYLFKTIPAGTFYVAVDSTTLPPGFYMTSGHNHWEVTISGGDNIVYVDFGFARNVELSCGRPVLAWYTASYKDSLSADRLRNWSAENHGGISDTAKFDLYADYTAVSQANRPALYHAQDADLWRHHIIAAWSAEIDAFVVPWYGPSSYEQGVVKGLLDAAETLYQQYNGQGFDFRIIAAYDENAAGSLTDNLRFLADSVLTHPAYYHGREGLPLMNWTEYPRPLYVYSPKHNLDAEVFNTERDRVLPSDVELVWNWDQESGYLSGLVEGIYPYHEAAEIHWDDAGGMEWGEAYLEGFYAAAQTMVLKQVVAGVWPGYDARQWVEGNGRWVDRQNGDVYRGTWNLARQQRPHMLLIHSWNDFNRGSQVHISELYKDFYYKLTRDEGIAWKGGRPCARSISDMGLTFAERLYNGYKLPLPEDILENALAAFFRRDFTGACSILEMGQASYVEGQRLGNKLVFVKGSPIHPGQGWDNAVDGDLQGWDGTVTTKPEGDIVDGTAWGMFRFADMGCYEFEYVRIIKDNGTDDNQHPERQASRVEVQVSLTGTKAEDFVSVGTIKVRDTNLTGYYRLNAKVKARYIKLLIHEPKWTSGGWRQIVEFGVDNGDKKGARPAAEQDGLSLAQVPEEFRAYNYPNPFNAQTTIAYQLPEDGYVSLKVYDVRGREVANLVDGVRNAGAHRVGWNSSAMASGLYFYRLRAGQIEQSGHMLLLK